MKKTINSLLVFALLLISNRLFAQQEVEMADAMRSNGKIYVVVSILLVIFVGIVGFLIFMDRKITRLEKRLPAKKDLIP
jgi:CcmD family protein